MSSKGSLSGRLELIRSSGKKRAAPVSHSQPENKLAHPWKLISPFVSFRGSVFKSPFIDSIDSGNANAPSLLFGNRPRDIENLLFYDLETTGLSGGAGTVAFLAGFGRIEDGKLIIDQYFLHDFPGEAAFLNIIKPLFEDNRILVSYNGKSFDHPLLRTRFLMNGLKLPLLNEIDLLHTVRRLWKGRLSSCRLSNIEDKILLKPRVADIPGIEVPDIYFSYLREGLKNPGIHADASSEQLYGVFSHHLQDINTLASLFAYIEKLWLKPDTALPEDRTALGKLLLLKGRTEGENLLCQSWKAGDSVGGRLLSIYYKRAGRLAEAVEIWKKMWSLENDLFQGRELAMYYEHKTKNIEPAIGIVTHLLQKEIIRGDTKMTEALKHRIKRLERKLSSSRDIC